MKTENNYNNQITREGTFTEKAFEIQSNPEAFSILFDHLYSDKILAVVREILCNAMDVTTDKMPYVTVPTHYDPVFVCRDYGTGLSHEDVMQLYTTVFCSTKTEDNTKIGGFGLGSKAPFAYTDSFSVTSVHGGVKRAYSMFKGETGIPKVALLGESPTDEPTGLEVSVAIKSQDTGAYYRAISQVTKHWDKLPELSTPVSYMATNIVHREGNIAFYKSDKYYAKPFVVLGGIEYPLSFASLSVDNSATLCEFPVYLYMDIGSVALAPSREALSYTPTTIEALGKALEAVLPAFAKYWQDKHLTTPGVRLSKVMEINRDVMRPHLSGDVLRSKAFTEAGLDYDVLRAGQSGEIHVNKEFGAFYSNVDRKSDTKIVWGTPSYSRIDAVSSAKFVIGDIKDRKQKRRANTHLRERGGHILMSADPGLKALADHWGFPFFASVEDLPVPTKEPRVRTPRLTLKHAEVSKFTGYTDSRAWADADLTALPATIFYVPLYRNQPVKNVEDPTNTITVHQLRKIQNKLETTGLGTHSVFGVNIRKINKIAKKSNWVNYLDYAKKEIASHFTPEYYAIKKNLQSELPLGVESLAVQLVTSGKTKSSYPEGHVLNSLLTKYELSSACGDKDTRTNIKNQNTYLETIADILRVPYESYETEEQDFRKPLQARYPLLQAYGTWGTNELVYVLAMEEYNAAHNLT